MREWRAHVGVVRVDVRVEVHERNLTGAAMVLRKQRVGDRVVASQGTKRPPAVRRELIDAPRHDRGDRVVDHERAARDVTGIDDLLATRTV